MTSDLRFGIELTVFLLIALAFGLAIGWAVVGSDHFIIGIALAVLAVPFVVYAALRTAG